MIMELKLCHIYPDLLNLYGDRGNVLCLQRRLEWRGIGVSVTELPMGDSRSLSEFDLFFIGGGQDFDQQVLMDDLKGKKAAEIRSAIEDGKTFLAVCGGYQLLGNSYRTWDGKEMDYIGAIDFETVGARSRMVGNFAFRSTEASGGIEIIGFENHSGRTQLGSGVQPLGTVTAGFGNNGTDGTEGVRYRNVFGTYCHGPVLPKNPAFCDFLLKTALEAKYGAAFLEPLADTEEQIAHDAAKGIIDHANHGKVNYLQRVLGHGHR